VAKVFLLSPAYCGGRRAGMLLRDGSRLALAQQLREGTLSLGAAFSFMSGLYFRGKIAYANAFGDAAGEGSETLIITPTRGLQTPGLTVTADVLREFAAVDVSLDDPRYRAPLERDVEALVRRLSAETRVVLLGSVATGKYVDLLCPALGNRLLYPSSFIGRGDMSRGGLLLRSASSAIELEYAVLEPGVRPRGPRPPKLEPLVTRSP
jgi:hypothetical protein